VISLHDYFYFAVSSHGSSIHDTYIPQSLIFTTVRTKSTIAQINDIMYVMTSLELDLCFLFILAVQLRAD